MNPQTEPKPNQKAASELPEQRRIVALKLRSSSTFNNSDTITIARSVVNPVASDVLIVPARFMANGDWRPCKGDEEPTGFGLSAQSKDPSGKPFIKRGWVPLSQLTEVVYGL